VYVLKLNDGESEVYDYFDSKTFYKVKSLSIRTIEGETNESTATYSDYKEVNGLLFPHQTNLSIGELNLSGTVSSIVINGKVDVNSFK